MKRILIFTTVLLSAIVFISIFIASDTVTSNTVTPAPLCGSDIYLFTGHPNCSGIWCGTGHSTSAFTTDSKGNFDVHSICTGTYSFCLQCSGGGNYTVTVDGIGAYIDSTASGTCLCGN